MELILRFAGALRLEPFVQSQRARNELISFAIQPVWEGLASERWTEGQLASLQRRLQSLLPLAQYPQAARGELVVHLEAWNRSLSTCVHDFARVQVSVDLATLTCALKQSRLDRGAYPETLGELVPDFLDSVPHDVVSGEALRYRRTEDGRFVLYSVGWNAQDDGGIRRSELYRVWRYR